MALVIYTLIAAALYHLAARAMITHWLWSRYPPRVDSFLQCAACAGTWYGFGIGAFGHDVLGWRFIAGEPWWSFIIVGLVTMVTTPILVGAQERALRYLGGEET